MSTAKQAAFLTAARAAAVYRKRMSDLSDEITQALMPIYRHCSDEELEPFREIALKASLEAFTASIGPLMTLESSLETRAQTIARNDSLGITGA